MRSKLTHRIENLALLLSLPKDETFESLICMGMVKEDPSQFSLVFHWPHQDTTSDPNPPRTLLGLFSAKDGIEPPSLTTRIQLALEIARIVRNFHRADWLHKVRSENILFFGSSNDPQQLIKAPKLAGFGYARLDRPTEISEQPSEDPKRDIYRHPDALGAPSESFNACMDLYSLGVVLLEIAEWRALQYLVNSVVNVDEEDVPLSQVAKVRTFLISGQGKGGTSKLRMRMGDIYADVCLMCLRGEISKSAVQANLGRAYGLIDKDIEKLESCRI
jgi:hypothetical protein